MCQKARIPVRSNLSAYAILHLLWCGTSRVVVALCVLKASSTFAAAVSSLTRTNFASSRRAACFPVKNIIIEAKGALLVFGDAFGNSSPLNTPGRRIGDLHKIGFGLVVLAGGRLLLATIGRGNDVREAKNSIVFIFKRHFIAKLLKSTAEDRWIAIFIGLTNTLVPASGVNCLDDEHGD